MKNYCRKATSSFLVDRATSILLNYEILLTQAEQLFSHKNLREQKRKLKPLMLSIPLILTKESYKNRSIGIYNKDIPSWLI